MFNLFNSSAPGYQNNNYALPIVINKGYEQFRYLPDEVKESIEANKNKINSEEDMDEFIRRQKLKQ